MRVFPVILAWVAGANAGDFFAGAMGGISTLSADARTAGAPPAQFSAYKPENGPTATVFGGRHFSDYFSAQLSYGWNQNAVALTGADVGQGASYELPMRSRMHTLVAEGMVYFRPATSRIRPYLSAGPGVSLLRASANGSLLSRGSLPPPAMRVSTTRPALRVAVGIDVRFWNSLWLRYSFSETLQKNGLSRALVPSAARNLANFQNWWGVSWQF
jgi:outer membrane protein with beta-barrel domain